MLTLQDGTELYYEVQGNLSAEKSILFLNGLTQSTASWAGITTAFQDYKIILPDLVFQGQSGASEKFRTFDQHASDIYHLIEHLQLSTIFLAGISYGGVVAQHLLVNYPDRLSGAALISTFAHKTAIFNSIGESWAAALDIGGYPLLLDVMLPYVLSENYFENPIIPINDLKNMRLTNQMHKDNIFKLMQATAESGDYRPELKKINKPVIVIHGEKDQLIPVNVGEEIHKHIAGSQFEIIKNAGHTLNLEGIPQTTKLIRSFLELI